MQPRDGRSQQPEGNATTKHISEEDLDELLRDALSLLRGQHVEGLKKYPDGKQSYRKRINSKYRALYARCEDAVTCRVCPSDEQNSKHRGKRCG
eukprot:m51a1_g12564 hypothetical protein (94) ;mRNA; r:1393-1937